MQDYSERRTIAYPADDLYEIVADVESYPKFLPWCVDARVVEKNDGIIIADLMIGFNALREKFRSIVELNRAELSVSSRQEKGPFRHLESRWLFTPSSETETMVDFTLSFEFRSRLLDRLMGAVFDKASRKMMAAFEARAVELLGGQYGP